MVVTQTENVELDDSDMEEVTDAIDDPENMQLALGRKKKLMFSEKPFAETDDTKYYK